MTLTWFQDPLIMSSLLTLYYPPKLSQKKIPQTFMSAACNYKATKTFVPWTCRVELEHLFSKQTIPIDWTHIQEKPGYFHRKKKKTHLLGECRYSLVKLRIVKQDDWLAVVSCQRRANLLIFQVPKLMDVLMCSLLFLN